MKKIIVGTIIGVFLVSVVGAFLTFENVINEPMSTEKTEVVFEVEPGQSFSAVMKKLETHKLIKSANGILLYTKINPSKAQIKVGEYMVSPHMRPFEIIDVLKSGKSIERKITISEGLNIFEIAELLTEAGFGKTEDIFNLLADKKFAQSLLAEDVDSLEGYLFPETYSYTKYTNLKSLITQMVQLSLQKWALVSEKAAVRGWSRHQVFTLASIIEKETGAPEERPLISSVFFNRLKKNMMLQTDPTVLYARALHNHKYEISITRADLQFQHPYNTYSRRGLPPGPIANPGLESLRAAVEPATSEYLFFVSRNEGTHVFTKDLASHNKAVSSYQLDPKAKEGKSWRDLKKNKPSNEGAHESTR